MRLLLLVVGTLAGTVSAGCASDPEAIDPGAIARADARAGAVRCSADEGGNLHVRAPADARVVVPSDAGDDPTVEVAYAEGETVQMPRPVRPRSRSLGFIGDAPLTQAPNRAGRWSHGGHDNLIPPHTHARGWVQPPYVAAWGRPAPYRAYGAYGSAYPYEAYVPPPIPGRVWE